MTRVGIIIGSTRPGRNGEAVGRWVHERASAHGGAEYELVDLADFDLAHLDESVPAAAGQYAHQRTRRWADTVRGFDAFVFVTPEYNHSMPGVLKTALDFVYAEWNHKAAGFVGYGVDGGVRAVEQLRQVMAHLKIADVGPQVTLSLWNDFVNLSEFQPDARHEASLATMLDELLSWARALRTVREEPVPEPVG
ncbi:NAD(P)H-dependent FMN reductase [Actinopolymorpha cephalotaxi]|uniref:NAD(P)H-dependent FMN reductase n=1 Tax=Actinopolymorpha cephalotaxi TaxID=504797 RepID=A0A1I2PEK5_9ACTN|nr:NAD(P)H-dependent oxidoreductase [Actinopolymorpha cephalotaxi]NYH83671.1 NAD(P)H-dependent FMN reductase [Actinopolymorpha cephalotaxi]SFG13559.1 NAD(P)H-dependent FMN reductase [Actinopolymorpha cephalotaxi]